MAEYSTSAEVRACKAIVKTLFSNTHKEVAWIFYDPVDAVVLGLHDYHDIVKEPMDLSTVRHRLNTGVYQTCAEFAKDMRLIFYNTYLYTNPGHLCYDMAKKLQLIFEHLFREVHQAYGRRYDVKAGTPSTPSTPSSASDSTLSVDEEGESSSSEVTPFREYAAPPECSSPGSDSSQELGSPFTAEEDIDLLAKIQQLDGEVLLHVIHLVQRMEGAACGNNEVEFDIRQLKVQTKRSIQKYLASKGITGKRMTRTKPKYD